MMWQTTVYYSVFYTFFTDQIGAGYHCRKGAEHREWWYCSAYAGIRETNARDAKESKSGFSKTVFIGLPFHFWRLHSTRIASDFTN